MPARSMVASIGAEKRTVTRAEAEANELLEQPHLLAGRVLQCAIRDRQVQSQTGLLQRVGQRQVV